MKTVQSVTRTLTLSKYKLGMHHFNGYGQGQISFAESMTPIHSMMEELFESGIDLGSKVEVIMRVSDESRPRKTGKDGGV